MKRAATGRVFGFEIMPAPFVVAHLQVGLTMQALDAPLADDGDERAGIFLTNALTGWEPSVQKPLPFPELEEERDRAERVKQDSPILVIIGNPPYNGFAGMAVDEERELSTAYRTTRRVRRPEGQGLNDLYVRFFRMAERRIAEKTGRGVVCFISQLLLARRPLLHRHEGAIPGVVRRNSHRQPQRRQVQDRQDDSRRRPGPQHLLDARGPGRHPDRHRNHNAWCARPTTRRPTTVELPPPMGTGQARETWTETAETEPDTLYDDTSSQILPLGLPFDTNEAVADDWSRLAVSARTASLSRFKESETARDSFLVGTEHRPAQGTNRRLL